MKKSYIYIPILIYILFFIPICIFNTNNNKVFNVNGVKYAVTVNGEKKSKFPDKGSYDVSISCTNATAIWNYEEWVAEIYNITSNVTCDITFTSKTAVYLNTYIKNTLTGTTQGTGQVVNEKGWRYEGKNPNNYIRFNNELWRIIGVFDSTSHGQSGKYLTKLIRDESIGAYARELGNALNNWPTSSLYKILNNYYFTMTNGTGNASCVHNTTVDHDLTGNCDFRARGIKNEYRNMVKNVTWYLGGSNSGNSTAANFYSYERSTSDTYYKEGNDKTTTGYVGLMYLSDYMYSVLSSSCARTTTYSNYSTTSCIGASWLSKEYEWTITPSTSMGNIFVVEFNMNSLAVTGGSSAASSHVRPVLYLDTSVKIIDGIGSKSDPYIIAM